MAISDCVGCGWIKLRDLARQPPSQLQISWAFGDQLADPRPDQVDAEHWARAGRPPSAGAAAITLASPWVCRITLLVLAPSG